MAAASRYTVAIEVEHTIAGWEARGTVNTYTGGRWISKPLGSVLRQNARWFPSFEAWARAALGTMAGRAADCIGMSTSDQDAKPCGEAVEADAAPQDG